MIQWETQVVKIWSYNQGEYGLEIVGQKFDPTKDSFKSSELPKRVMEVSNQLGSQGWQFVQATETMLIFQRPKIASEQPTKPDSDKVDLVHYTNTKPD